MADGITHANYQSKGWIFVFILVAILGYIAYELKSIFYLLTICFVLINYPLGNICEPDNDLIGTTTSEGKVLRFTRKFSPLGGFFGVIWVNWWTIYAFIMSYFGGHRGLSHTHILGTLTRIIFFNIPIVVSFFIGAKLANIEYIILYKLLFLEYLLFPYLLGQFLALTISDEIHLFCDSKFFKHYFLKEKTNEAKTRRTNVPTRSGAKSKVKSGRIDRKRNARLQKQIRRDNGSGMQYEKLPKRNVDRRNNSDPYGEYFEESYLD
jgi:uncharacterized metal-binding protein